MRNICIKQQLQMDREIAELPMKSKSRRRIDEVQQSFVFVILMFHWICLVVY